MASVFGVFAQNGHLEALYAERAEAERHVTAENEARGRSTFFVDEVPVHYVCTALNKGDE